MVLEDLYKKDKNVREIYLELELNGVIKDITPNCSRLLGYERELMIGKSINDFTYKQVDINFLTSENNVNGFSIAFRKVNGEIMYTDAEYVIQHDSNKLSQINLSLIDISKYKIEQEKLKTILQIFEKSNDIIYSLDIKPEPKYTYLSPAIEKNLGYTLEDNDANPLLAYDVVHPDYSDIQIKKITGEADYDKHIVTRYKHKVSGEYIWFEDYLIPIYDKSGELIRIDGICRNIQQRKELEEQLRYLSYHDTLTGLYNRAYFDMKTKQLNNEIDARVGILVCDLDNLKEINDELGHDQGDLLIKETGKIIKSCLEKYSGFRFGGDEFVVIFENVDCEEVQAAIDNFRCQINKYNKYNSKIPIKISMGLSYIEHSLERINEVFKEADRNMYKDKLNNKISEKTVEVI